MSLHRADRRGFALAVSMMAIVVIGALIAGAFFASTQEYRVGRNTLVGQRAFTVAEFGLNKEISEWDRARNLPGGMSTGEIDASQVYVVDGDTAFVTITKLNDNTFWVVSEGQASMGNAQLKSRARTNAYVRIAYPTVMVRGALTTAGSVDLRGTASVTGMDVSGTNPWMSNWDQCDSIPMENMAGVTVGETATVDGSSRITGDPAIDRTPIASDSMTYIRYGSETWNTLRDNADIKMGGAYGAWDPIPRPSGDSLRCTVTDKNNWGEPGRLGFVTNYIHACRNYFPIIYYDGDLDLQANGRGQGILMVNGDLRVRGTFDFYGLIIVKDDIERASGTMNIFGSVMSRNVRLIDMGSVLTGTQNINFSTCAVESALRGSAILVQVRERGWAQLF
jgi:hypothetical protein